MFKSIQLKIVAGILVIIAIVVLAAAAFRFATTDLRSTIELQQEQIKAQTALMQQQTAIIQELSLRPTYSITNRVDGGKKKNNIVLVPESNLNVGQPDATKHPPDVNKR